MEGPSVSNATSTWSRAELLAAKRAAKSIKTVYGSGTIEAVRHSDVVIKLPFGTAYLQLDALREEDIPGRFTPGTRVATPYGKGVVKRVRTSDVHIDYEIALVDWKLANDVHPMAYIDAEQVSLRPSLTFDEMVADAEEFRLRGNAAYKAGDYDGAINEYRRIAEVMGHAKPGLSDAQKDLLRDAVVKSLLNSAACFLSMEKPQWMEAVRHASEALQIDPLDKLGQRSKALLRMAKGLIGLQRLEEACQVLADPSLVPAADGSSGAAATASAKADAAIKEEAAKLLRATRERLRAQAAKEKAMWSKAFNKDSAGEDGGASASASPAKGGVSFASPSADASTPAAARGASASASTPTTGGASPAADGKASAFAGRTPHPKSKLFQEASGVGDAVAEEEAEQEEEEEEGDSNWAKYLTYGALAVGAVAVGAFALSKLRGRG